MTRWEQLYQEDERVIRVHHSLAAERAAEAFRQRSARLILDLGCGVGRDTFYLCEEGLQVIGADAAESGLALTIRNKRASGGWPLFVQADARELPFLAAHFEGLYCFGLLHEFTGETKAEDVHQVMSEILRVLKPGGLLALAVLSGDPEKGLPHVQLFTEQMFDEATASFHLIEKQVYDDVGCTGRMDYRVWRGLFAK